jgi:hypothetical protein
MPLTAARAMMEAPIRHGDDAMANAVENGAGRMASPWRIAGWGTAALILLLPLVAMRFTDEVNWTGSDFIFAAVLMGGVGGLFELTVRMSRNHAYRAGAGLALAAAFLIVWVNGAVGMIGSEDNSYNLLFGGVILLALAGALAARFRAPGMALAMLAAGIAHGGIALFGMAADPRGGVFSMAFAGLWLLSAALFRKAARERSSHPTS